MILIPIETAMIEDGDDVVDILIYSLKQRGEKLINGDVLAVADKIIAISEGSVKNLVELIPSTKAKRWAQIYGLDPRFVELVIREADEIYGGTYRAILTLKNGVMIANSGIDRTNVPDDYVALWSKEPNKAALTIRQKIGQKIGVNVGVILIDSKVEPLRMGTTGFALGIAGFKPLEDLRGKKDLFNKTLYITRLNVADDLAAAAHLLMGESNERTPFVIIRGAPVTITDRYDADNVKISKEECLYMGNLRSK